MRRSLEPPRRESVAKTIVIDQSWGNEVAMKFLLVVMVLIAIAVAVGWAIRRNRQARPPLPPRTDPFATDAGRPDPRRLKVGDVVGFEGRDYVVRGTIRFDQSGFVWDEHLLDDTRERVWLSVEDDEGLEFCLWDRLTGSPLEPGPTNLSHDGAEYRRHEGGRRRSRAKAPPGPPPPAAWSTWTTAPATAGFPSNASAQPPGKSARAGWWASAS